MNNQEARFILGAYRPDGRDAGDPVFAGALAQAGLDPELRDWLEAQRTFDRALAAKLQQVTPPPGLREAILAGSRASAPPPSRRWWTSPGWLAAAAALVLLAALAITLRPAGSSPTAEQLARFAMRDLAETHDRHVARPEGLSVLQTQLARSALPLTKNLTLDVEDLRRNRCRSITIQGREVFEVCFLREGAWYHVYVGRRRDFAPGAVDPQALTQVNGQFAGTAWADATHIYAIVTSAGSDALRRAI
jgi:hypothetical protein